MKLKKSVSYFPVSAAEQALLLRVREHDLVGRTDDLLVMLDQIAEANLTPGDLEQAVQLLIESRRSEGLDARFDNLEARLKERIARSLMEIEGRLSKRLGGDTPQPAPALPVRAPTTVPTPSPQVIEPPTAIPETASIAFRIGPDLVWGESATRFYVSVWKWLLENRKVQHGDLPIQGGKQRYVVAASPVHPTGNEFTRSEEPVPGVFIEVNLSRNDIIRRSKKYLAQYDVPFEVVVGSEQ
jgi:hypothetical protein